MDCEYIQYHTTKKKEIKQSHTQDLVMCATKLE